MNQIQIDQLNQQAAAAQAAQTAQQALPQRRSIDNHLKARKFSWSELAERLPDIIGSVDGIAGQAVQCVHI